jgi:hypothetical protein
MISFHLKCSNALYWALPDYVIKNPLQALENQLDVNILATGA